jgi:hypothetical protein
MEDRETPFATENERHFFTMWKESEKNGDRLRRENDSLRESARCKDEILRRRSAEESIRKDGLRAPIGPQGLLVGLLLFLSQFAHAYEFSLGYGANPPWTTIHVKTAQASISNPLYGHLWHRISYGHWFESGPGGGGGITAYSLGSRIHAEPFYAELWWGVGYTPNPDMYWLSSRGQFVNDVGFGLMATEEVGIGIAWRHASNAGIVPPNRGRDFILITTRFPL